jgi:hypothetical protein
MLPAEKMELMILKYVDRVGPVLNTNIPSLAAAIGINTPHHLIIERLKDLDNQRRILLSKISGNIRVPFSQRFIAIEGESAFWNGGFIIEIAPQGRKYFEELIERDRFEVELRAKRTNVFISCGQYTQEEIWLGKELALAVDAHTSYKGYFAENQNSLESLSHHILNALDECAGFVAVMHNRGDVHFSNGSHHTRGSVWVEQEVAIAAFLTQIRKRRFPIAFYIQKGIKREGVREHLRIASNEFENESTVLEHFKEELTSGRFKPLAQPNV